MGKRLAVIIIIIAVMDTVNTIDAFCFGSNYTHPEITELAIDKAVKDGGIDRILKEELEFKDGIETPFVFSRNISGSVPEGEIERNNDILGKSLRRGYPTRFGEPYKARYLIIAGSEAEDHPTERAQHHFLDPLSNKGLDNNYYGVGILADFIALFYPPAEQGNVGRFVCSLVSLCDSSFNLDGTSAVERVEGKTSGSYPVNYFAWPDTRRYFYNALTAKTKEEREHYFALSLFSLGHNLHLLEDMGVPAHTRNDFIYDHIWHGLIRGSYLEGYVESGRIVEKTAGLRESVSFNKLANFWDNNGTNVLPGLAEYTNYNFLSEGTIFKDYENPVWISMETYEDVAEDNKRDRVQYYTGRTSDGVEIPHLAAVGMLDSALDFLDLRERARHSAYLDPSCYKDYSDVLIPRIIPYVSGLIEYFFRGKIAVIKDGTSGIKIKNLSTEPLSNGVFEIYYDSTEGIRNILASYEMSPDAPLMPEASTEKISFDPPLDNIAPGRYTVVFKGRLGEEDGAVIGKMVKEKILFVSDRNGSPEIYSMGKDGTDIRIIVSNTEPYMTYTRPVASPDGTKIAFHSNREGSDSIWIVDSGTGDLRKIAEGRWPDWSPDGRQIVYYKSIDGKGDIFSVDLETREEIRLTDDLFNNLWPAWSPDGSKIAYTSQRDGKGDIIIKDLSGNMLENLTQWMDNLDRWKPAWSPDGRRIAYEKPTKAVYAPDEPFYVNIHALDMNTGVEIDLTNIDSTNRDYGVWNGTPHWIDNKNIIIESNVAGDAWSDLWIIDAGGSGFIKRITDTPGHDGYPFMW